MVGIGIGQKCRHFGVRSSLTEDNRHCREGIVRELDASMGPRHVAADNVGRWISPRLAGQRGDPQPDTAGPWPNTTVNGSARRSISSFRACFNEAVADTTATGEQILDRHAFWPASMKP